MKIAQIALGVFLSVSGLLLSLSLGIYFMYWGVVDLQANRMAAGLLKLLFWAEVSGLLCILLLLAPGLYILRRVRPDPPSAPPAK